MKTILIVDDFASVRLYHKTFLAQKGYACLEASEGADALEKLSQHPVDLVLLDMVMPKMSGAQFIERVCQNTGRGHVPILAITSEALAEETKAVQAKYSISLLLKPVMPDVLLHAVQQILA